MDVGALVAAHLPGHPVSPVVPVGAGLENVAYEVGDGLIVRFSREPDAAATGREAALLAAVAEVSPLPVPAPVFAVPRAGCLAYPKLPGRAVLDLPAAGRPARAAALGTVLGGFLAALHAAPVSRFAGLAAVDDEPLAAWVDEAAGTWPAVAGRVPERWHPAIAAFLGGPPPVTGYEPVFTHDDLGIEHVLADPDTWDVTGVIDWTDAAVTDPARDFGRILRDLGPAGLDAALSAAGRAADADLRERATAYARCGALEDLAYGLSTGRPAYTAKSLTALEWLFRP
jgi:aminoglycoside phosphotransferase (APT) family kinase protein